MKPSLALVLSSLALGLAGCDRAPRGSDATARPTVIQAGAVTVPTSPSTVALSGAIRDLPATTTPDALPVPRGPVTSPRPSPPRAAGASTTPAPRAPTSTASVPRGETQAMREFREAQERRDRELLESDMNDAGADRGRAARPVDEGAASRDELPADASGWTDEGARGPVDEGLADEDVGGPGVDDPFADEMLADEPPPDEFGDELPPEEDDELRWDPETQSWR